MTDRLTIPVSDRDHVSGPRDAATVLVEYGDFECPFCGAAYPIVESIRKKLGDQLCYVFRHFPITESHPHAEAAAEAAEAAGAQGKFWEMYHMLFEHQGSLERDDLLGYARALQLDTTRFSQDLAVGTYAARVHEDFMSGLRSGVNGTPTFFINGVRYDGVWDNQRVFADALAKLSHVT